MAGAARLGDKAQGTADAHGCLACPHPTIGPIIAGSGSVNINSRPAARLNDPGLHAVCCGPNTFNVFQGSQTVFINGKPAARMGDQSKHCGGLGKIIEGSTNVIIGGAPSSGAGASGGNGGSGGAGATGGSGDGTRGVGGANGPGVASRGGATANSAPPGESVGSRSAPEQAANPAEESKPTPQNDEMMNTAIQVRVQGHGKQVEGLTVVVQHDDGREERLRTNAAGEVNIRHKPSTGFRVVAIEHAQDAWLAEREYEGGG
jgi:uncharacterized Zn-binding protein involved in type VI secretion